MKELAEEIEKTIRKFMPKLDVKSQALMGIAIAQASHAIAELVNERQPECGHPIQCIVSTGEGTNYCGMCALEVQVEEMRPVIQAVYDYYLELDQHDPERVLILLGEDAEEALSSAPEREEVLWETEARWDDSDEEPILVLPNGKPLADGKRLWIGVAYPGPDDEDGQLVTVMVTAEKKEGENEKSTEE